MKKFFYSFLLIFLFWSINGSSADASIFGDALKKTAEKTDLSQVIDLPAYVANIIAIVLTFIGIIFLALIIYGGFLYMTSMGDSTKVKKGKDVIIASIIGLIIILSGYSITYFVASQLEQPGTGAPGPLPAYEDTGNLDYDSLNACEYRYARYQEVSPSCCAQSAFCKAHLAECQPCCGDGTCSSGENPLNCYDDCPSVCGDGYCTLGENHTTCPADCGIL